jgi:hypothetical protein
MMAKQNPIVCMWCQKPIVNPAGKDTLEVKCALINHLLKCFNHPLVCRIKELQEENIRYKTTIKRMGKRLKEFKDHDG